MTGEDRSVDRDPLDRLAEEFIERFRCGERPSVAEYEKDHPDLGQELRELLPTLMLMEDARPSAHDGGGRELQVGPHHSLGLQRIGDYRILREVGRGGMGIVYEAEQESLGRRVALKVLPKHALLYRHQLERFRREARAAARLHHTNIVPVFGTGEQDGLHYHVMQFIHGLGLDEVLVEVARLRHAKNPLSASDNCRGGSSLVSEVAQSLIVGRVSGAAAGPDSSPPHRHATRSDALPCSSPLGAGPAASTAADPSGWNGDGSTSRMHLPGQDVTTTESGISYWRSIARIGVQVADALAYANAQGVLHRDIKPSNLLLDTEGTVWITDFGLAKADESDDLTHTGDVVGTLRYLAPERFRGQADQRSDIYSLGITLYELLTLRHPLASIDRQQLVRKISDEEPPRPRSLDRALPRDLETIVLKAIAKRPADRYQNAGSLANDLRRFLEDRPIQARRIGTGERCWRWLRRNPTVSSLAAAVVLLASLLGAGLLVTQIVLNQRNRAFAAEKLARKSLDRAEQAERDVQIRSYLAQAVAHRRSGRMGQRFQCLDALAAAVKLGPSPEITRELRDEAIAALGLTDLRIQVNRPVGFLTGVHLDRALQRYAFVDFYKGGHTSVRRLDNDTELLRVPHPGFSFWHATTGFTPDGQQLFICYFPSNAEKFDAVLHVWHLQRREFVSSHEIRTYDVQAAIAAHGQRLFFVTRSSELCVWNLASGGEEKRIPLGMIPYSICVDSEGRRAAINDAVAPLVRILDLESGEDLAAWSRDVGNRGMAWSGDGQLLAVGDESGEIFIRHVPTGEVLSVLEGPVIWVAFSNQGYLLATAGWSGTTELWDAVTGTRLVQGLGGITGFSPDDQQLGFFHNNGIGIWQIAHGLESRLPLAVAGPQSQGGHSASLGGWFSPDGRFLATADLSGVRFLDIRTASELARITFGSATTPVVFCPGGQGLVTYSGRGGLYRWPMQPTRVDGVETLRVGPPQLLATTKGSDFVAATYLPADQSVALAEDNSQQVHVVRLAETQGAAERFSLQSEHGRITNLAASPDGRWLAAGGWKEQGIQIWNLPERRLERVLPHSDSPTATRFRVYFSPDNRWLVSAASSDDGQSYLTYSVGSWERGWSMTADVTANPRVAFSTDSRRVAIGLSATEVLIADPRDGREFGRLTSAQPGARPAAFSDDGSELLLSAGGHPMTLWNLRRLDEQLRQIGLAWDSPAGGTEPSPLIAAGDTGGQPDMISPAPQPTLVSSPLRIDVDLRDFPEPAATNEKAAAEQAQHANMFLNAESWASARAALERSIELHSTSAWTHNALAWLLLTCPDTYYRDHRRGLVAATCAVELEPDRGSYRNTLGVAQYRAGDWHAAIRELTKAEELAPGQSFAHNSLFLAMAHSQLGDQVSARDWFDRAIAWIESHARTTPQNVGEIREIAAFRAEADVVLASP